MLHQATILLLMVATQCVLFFQEASAARQCFIEGSYCNPQYLCPCCPKLFFEDGTQSGMKENVGVFCNMENAIVIEEGYRPDPYPQGCCQRCMSEGDDGCTNEMNPCCPDHTAVPDASCPAGQTKCQRTSASLTYESVDYAWQECKGKIPECYSENMFCNGRVWKCCDGLICNSGGDRNAWGVCQRNGSLVPSTPTPLSALPQPTAPLDPKCLNWRNTTHTTIPPSANADTTIPPSASAAPTEAATMAPGTAIISNGSCAAVGGYCDYNVCCPGLECPNNWWFWWIIRWILNLFGLWYRVCRDYGPCIWYLPYTCFDY